MSELLPLSDQSIPEFLATEGVSVVLLTSSWDGNGVIMRVILAGLTEEFSSINFYEADYDTSPRLARLFNLLSPPGLLFIKDGELLRREAKPMSAGSIRTILQSIAS